MRPLRIFKVFDDLLSGERSLPFGLLVYIFLQVGTSSVVYPAAMFAPQVAQRGVPVAEFNMEETDVTSVFG